MISPPLFHISNNQTRFARVVLIITTFYFLGFLRYAVQIHKDVVTQVNSSLVHDDMWVTGNK